MFGKQRHLEHGDQIHVLSKDSKTRRAVAATVEADTALRASVVGLGSMDDLAGHLAEPHPALFVVDIDADPDGMLGRLDALSDAVARHRVVVVSSSLDSALMLEAMQVGARHCMAKANLGRDLVPVLVRLTRGLHDDGDAGARLITVLSSSGGCGATTVAINLADQAGRGLDGESALLVDLDEDYGSAACYLGLSGMYGVGDVIQEPDAIDPQLLRSTTTKHTDGLHVLLSPATVDFSDHGPLDHGAFASLAAACRQAYPVTVVDAPRVPMSTAAVLASASSRTLLVLELSVVGVRNAHAMATALCSRGIPSERLLLVANRHRKRSKTLSLADAEKALPGFALTSVTNDYESAIRAANLGQTLAEAAPRSAIRRDLRRILDTIQTGALRRAG